METELTLPQALSPSKPETKRLRWWNHLARLWAVHVVEGILWKRRLKEFFMVFGGHIYFQTVSAAVQFDLFSRLSDGKRTAGEIAQLLGLAEQPCRILLLGLTSLGLLKKKGDCYQNSAIAERYLTNHSPRSFTKIILWQHFINYRSMFHFTESLKSNSNVGLRELPGEEPTLYGRLAHDPARERIFQGAMEQISRQATGLLARFLNVGSVTHLVDIGGGNGTNIIHLALRNPDLRASVFDSPTVCAIARSNIDVHGLSDRLGAMEGDCFKDSFPAGADAFLFCHFFTIWSKEKNLELLKKAYRSLPAGGRAIIFNMMQNDRGDGPMSAALGSPYFLTLATGQGMLYSWLEYESLFQEAGFKDVKRLRLPMDHGVLIGVKT